MSALLAPCFFSCGHRVNGPLRHIRLLLTVWENAGGECPAPVSVGAGLPWASRAPGRGPLRFACDQCGKAYNLRHTLLRHMRLECGKEPQFQCPHCPKRSKRRRTLGPDQRGALWGLGGGPSLFACDQCGKAYNLRHTLLRHMRLECGKEPQFQCPHCPKRSKRRSNLLQHIRIIHGL
ncbi:zinc finger protein 397-like [Bacillus rossius redtenbacheri]|uniref:zinc finger protein 397-like n=1 Tax=Bacillus rossius redtenbacheri TaxID=93214 RepID=UPI002FDE3442